ncbi:MAG: NAD+ synthase [Actinobacteria bacterium]|nr:NAD+ synthase [Actinomycetota bacterium]
MPDAPTAAPPDASSGRSGSQLRVAVAQLNPTVGDLDGNVERLLAAYRRADLAGADIMVAGELAISGYPPEDLLLKPRFVDDNLAALERVAAATGDTVAIIGVATRVRNDPTRLHNSAAVCANGRVVGVFHKRLLPNYEVFDEKRYFTPGSGTLPMFNIAGVPVAVVVCEDAWHDDGPHAAMVAAGARAVIVVNGSPYHLDKDAERESLFARRASELGVPFVYANQVGGQDELVFDGGSFTVDAAGAVIARSPLFVEDLAIVEVPTPPAAMSPEETLATAVSPHDSDELAVMVDHVIDDVIDGVLDPTIDASRDDVALIDVTTTRRSPAGAPGGEIAPEVSGDAELYDALVAATRDYCHKNGFRDVVIGLSGGIDSTIVACIAVDALGADHVHGVAMPSRYSSDHSISDAEALAGNLGIECRTIAIEPAVSAFEEMLAASFAGRDVGLAWENMQSRCRGQILMALSNEMGWMVLTTGNKSEVAVGYFTIYGDAVGGYGPIKDVLKTRVYDLCRFVNARAGREVVPNNVLVKPPSAELRPDQRDDQSLPAYEVLDPILAAYVEQDRTAAEIIADGHDAEMVQRITRLVDIAEYKRRQTPLGVRVTRKAFGRDRRLPVTNRYR